MSGLVGWMRILEMASTLAKPTFAQVLPASVGLVDAVAGHDVAADARLAHADVHDVGIRLRDSYGADRGAADLAVGDRRPGVAGIDSLPQPAADRAEVCLERPPLTPATAIERPPRLGPMLRQRYAPSSASSTDDVWASSAGGNGLREPALRRTGRTIQQASNQGWQTFRIIVPPRNLKARV